MKLLICFPKSVSKELHKKGDELQEKEIIDEEKTSVAFRKGKTTFAYNPDKNTVAMVTSTILVNLKPLFTQSTKTGGFLLIW
jgi:hypothetical protein